MQKSKSVFIKGAYLSTLDKDMTEEEFLAVAKKAGTDLTDPAITHPFVSICIDDPKHPVIVLHNYGRGINATMQIHDHGLYQTMEYRKRR